MDLLAPDRPGNPDLRPYAASVGYGLGYVLQRHDGRPHHEVLYEATLEGSVDIDGRDHWIILLEARVKGLSYPKRRAWVDKEYLLPMKEELYAKSGKLLKTSTMSGARKVQGRWFPSRFNFKDELKRNSRGTEWVINDIQFDVDIPNYRFSKAALRK